MKVLLFSVVLMLMACVGSAQATDRKVAVEEFGLTADLDGNDRIRLENFYYVDKTTYLRELVKIGWSPTKTGGHKII